MSFAALKVDIFFIRLKSSDQKKGNYVVVLSLVSTIRGTNEDPCDYAYKNSQINCNVKGCDACKKMSLRCYRKATLHYNGKLQEVFRAELNESKYDYVD